MVKTYAPTVWAMWFLHSR